MINFFKHNYQFPTYNPRISVIMPVFLGEYANAASDRESKFMAAINSFLRQIHLNKELIIISDGCDMAEKIYNGLGNKENIIFKKIKKQPLFSGKVRNEGVKIATGDIICYLDADDFFGFNNHLSVIANAFISDKILNWVYYNDYLYPPNNDFKQRLVLLEKGSVGTSAIAHKRVCKVSWKNCNGYNHDWLFIEQLIKKYPTNYTKIYGCGYFVCHVPGVFG